MVYSWRLSYHIARVWQTMSQHFHSTSFGHSGLLVTHSELQELSGFKQPSRIAAWLKLNGIPFWTARKGGGWPRVLRRVLQKVSRTQAAPEVAPDHSWMKKG